MIFRSPGLFCFKGVNILNERQQRFCDEYLIDCNAVQAAIRAGYSPKTARFAAEWINERNPQKPTSKFNAEMKAYIDAKLEAMHNAKTADAQEVLEYLTSGITPAWAGKRHKAVLSSGRYGDHPRVGGEKYFLGVA